MGLPELRRLAFLKIAAQLGLPLSAVGAILDAPSPQWRQAAREQLVELDQLIERAQAARAFVSSAVDCPAEHPASQCPVLIDALDRLLAGARVEELAPKGT